MLEGGEAIVFGFCGRNCSSYAEILAASLRKAHFLRARETADFLHLDHTDNMKVGSESFSRSVYTTLY